MKSILTFFFAILAFSAFANFTGYYDLANWTETHSSDCDNGYVDLDFTSPPQELFIVGSGNAVCGASVFGYSIPLTACGTITFTYIYDGTWWLSPFGYSVNGVPHQLTNNTGDYYGNVSVDVSIGDVFSFYISKVANSGAQSLCEIIYFSGPSNACQNGNKVSVCHNGNTICIAPAAVPAHLAHGDYLGECGTPGCAPQQGGNSMQSIINALDPEADKEGKATLIRSSMITLEQTLVKEPTKIESKMIDVYPNPANDHITVVNSPDKNLGTVSIMDITGKIIFQKNYTNSEARINVQDFAPGIYFLKSSQGKTMKFVKQ